MPRVPLSRVWYAAVVFVTAGLALWNLVTEPARFLLISLICAAFVLGAEVLRGDRSGVPAAYEAPSVFAAVVLTHDAGVALLSVALGATLYAVYRCVRQHVPVFDAAYDVAQKSLSYYVVGLLYASAVHPDAPVPAKVSGYILLVVGYLGVHLFFASLRRYTEVDAVDLLQVFLSQGKTLLLLSPFVAFAVVLYQTLDVTGFALALVPVLICAHAMRGEADAGQRNAELIRRNRELSILTESSTQILSAEDDQETLRRLMALLSKLAPMKACAAITWQPTADVPATVYRFGDCEPSDQDIIRWADVAGFEQSAPSRPFIFQDGLRKFPLTSGPAIQLLQGIQTAEVIYGVLIFETEDPAILRSGSLNLLALLVNQTALALQDQLLRREMREKTIALERQAETTSMILDVGNSLIGSFDLDGALTRIAHAVRRALGFEIVVIALHDPKKDEFVRRAHAGLDDVWDSVRKSRLAADEIRALFRREFKISNSYYIPTAALRQSERDFFLRTDTSYARSEEWNERDILITPLMRGEEIFGYLSVSSPIDRCIPTPEKVKNLEVFAIQAVQALQSSRQYEEIERLSFTDALTPAFNHRYFQDALAKEIHRHSRSGDEFTLALLDIDDFKKINDTFGHPVGDDILRGIVDEMMKHARDTDIVARYGGEEFAIIFPQTPATHAREGANRLRELVERREHVIAQVSRKLRVTVSVGVAIYPRDGVTNADLIARADAALYLAKKRGKNQVALAAEVSGAGSVAL